jgi:hypothetical protein
MPPDHGLGFDQGEGVSPAAPHSAQENPEQSVGASQAWARRGALEDGQLMAQREILEYQGVGVRTPRRRPVRMRVSMVAIIHRAGRTFNGDEADGVSRRHSPPQGIRRGHIPDEGGDLGIDGRAAPRGPTGQLSPVLAEASALPSQDGVGGHDDQSLPPAGPVPVRNLIGPVSRWLHTGFDRPGPEKPPLRYGDAKGGQGRRLRCDGTIATPRAGGPLERAKGESPSR